MRGPNKVLIFSRPQWYNKAACRGMDVDMFYLEEGETDYSTINGAKAICAECPVQLECLKWAVDNGEYEFGIWGGVGATMRRPGHARKTIAKIEEQIERKRILRLDGEDRRKAFAKMNRKKSSA